MLLKAHTPSTISPIYLSIYMMTLYRAHVWPRTEISSSSHFRRRRNVTTCRFDPAAQQPLLAPSTQSASRVSKTGANHRRANEIPRPDLAGQNCYRTMNRAARSCRRPKGQCVVYIGLSRGACAVTWAHVSVMRSKSKERERFRPRPSHFGTAKSGRWRKNDGRTAVVVFRRSRRGLG